MNDEIRAGRPGWKVLMAASLVLLSAACGDDENGGSGATDAGTDGVATDQGDDRADGVDGATESATATSSGGTLSFHEDAVTLEVPPGAVTEDEELTVTIEEAEVHGATAPVITLGPEGAVFEEPVTVRIAQDLVALDGQADPGHSTLAVRVVDRWYREHSAQIDEDTGEVVFELLGFSDPTLTSVESMGGGDDLPVRNSGGRTFAVLQAIYVAFSTGNPLPDAARTPNACPRSAAADPDIIPAGGVGPMRTCPGDDALLDCTAPRLCCGLNERCKTLEEALGYYKEVGFPRAIVVQETAVYVSGVADRETDPEVGGTTYPLILPKGIALVGEAQITLRADPGVDVLHFDVPSDLAVVQNVELESPASESAPADADPRTRWGAALTVDSGTVVLNNVSSEQSSGVYVTGGGALRMTGGELKGPAGHLEIVTDHLRSAPVISGGAAFYFSTVLTGVEVSGGETRDCTNAPNPAICETGLYIESENQVGGQLPTYVVSGGEFKGAGGCGVWYPAPVDGHLDMTGVDVKGNQFGICLGYLDDAGGNPIVSRTATVPAALPNDPANRTYRIEGGDISGNTDTDLVVAVLEDVTMVGELFNRSMPDEEPLVVSQGQLPWIVPSNIAYPLRGVGAHQMWPLVREAPPSARFGAAGCYDGTNVVLFGGRNNGGSIQDTAFFDWTELTWQTLGADPFTLLTAREFAAMASDPGNGRCFMFGGRDADPVTAVIFPDPGNETMLWRWQGRAWTQLEAEVDPWTDGVPVARYGATFTSIDGRYFLLFGGNDGAAMLDDWWIYDATDNNWFDISNQTLATSLTVPDRQVEAYTLAFVGDAPAARQHHSAVSRGNGEGVLIYGGTDTSTDLYAFHWHECLLGRVDHESGSFEDGPCDRDLADPGTWLMWTKITNNNLATEPGPYFDIGLSRTHDTSAGNAQLVLFGGSFFDTSVPSVQRIQGDFLTYLGDTSDDFTSGEWHEWPDGPLGPAVPTARRFHTMVTVDGRGLPNGTGDIRTFIYGGQQADDMGIETGAFFGDAWVYMRGGHPGFW